MNWVIYSAIMFFGSISYYLVVKKVQNLGVNKDLYMLINSIVPTLLFLVLSLIIKGNLNISWVGFIIAAFTAFILNYFGSVTGYLGIKDAPNAGYSVIIQKSYAIYTTVISVWLFNSEFSLYKIFGIALTLVFTAIISVEKSEKKFKVGKWVIYSLISFLLFGGTTITAKYINIIGDDPNIYMFWVMLMTVLISTVPFIKSKQKISLKENKNQLLWLFLMSALVSIFYWGKNMSTITAPNIGYTGAINASSNAFLTIISALIYKQELKFVKFLSVIGVTIGIIILIS